MTWSLFFPVDVTVMYADIPIIKTRILWGVCECGAMWRLLVEIYKGYGVGKCGNRTYDYRRWVLRDDAFSAAMDTRVFWG